MAACRNWCEKGQAQNTLFIGLFIGFFVLIIGFLVSFRVQAIFVARYCRYRYMMALDDA